MLFVINHLVVRGLSLISGAGGGPWLGDLVGL